MAAQAEVTRATSVPVAAGENEYTRYGFRDLISHRAVDILQPDALILGGITEFMKVVAIPNGLILEYYRDSVNPMHGKVWKHELEIKDGYVYAPDRAGLGLEPKWDTLEPYRVG